MINIIKSRLYYFDSTAGNGQSVYIRWTWLVSSLTLLGGRQDRDETNEHTETSVDSDEDLILLAPWGQSVVEEEQECSQGSPDETYTGAKVQTYNVQVQMWNLHHRCQDYRFWASNSACSLRSSFLAFWSKCLTFRNLKQYKKRLR